MASATYGTMEVTLKNYRELIGEFNLMPAQATKVINRTVGDFKKRGPGWVSQEVCKEYNIKKKEVTAAKTGTRNKAGTISIRGRRLDSLSLVYEGRLLTPTHFTMKPTSRPAGNRRYNISAKIKKTGGRKVLSSRAFLGHSGRAGTIQIPFQRVGESRLPINAIKTLSIPQMITNEQVGGRIHDRIEEELGKRFEHNLNQIMSRSGR